MTGGSGSNTYAYSATDEDFSAASVTDLIAAADTITNWSNGTGSRIYFAGKTLVTTTHKAAPLAGAASISAGGLATFDATDATLAKKLAAVVAVAGQDLPGTAVVFNDGNDAWLYVVGDATAGVQPGDALIKLNGVGASGIEVDGSYIVGFYNSVDVQAAAAAAVTAATVGASVAATAVAVAAGAQTALENAPDNATKSTAQVNLNHAFAAADNATATSIAAATAAQAAAAAFVAAAMKTSDSSDDAAAAMVVTTADKLQVSATDAAATLATIKGKNVYTTATAAAADANTTLQTAKVVTPIVSDAATAQKALDHANLVVTAAAALKTAADAAATAAASYNLAVKQTVVTSDDVVGAAAVAAAKAQADSAALEKAKADAAALHAADVKALFTAHKPATAADMLAVGNVISNWQSGSQISIESKTLAIVAHSGTPAPGVASVSGAGLARFDAADATLERKLAAVVAAAGTDAAGTSIVFNHGGDAYAFVVGDATTGVQPGDTLVKLTGITAGGLTISGGKITGVPMPDTTAPMAMITQATYNDSTGTLTLSGYSLDTLLSAGEDSSTDLKANLDWSKLSLHANAFGVSMSTSVKFTLDDIVSANVSGAYQYLNIVLKPAKVAAVKATIDQGTQGLERVEISAGFLMDRAGNAAISDAKAVFLMTEHSETLNSTDLQMPVTDALKFIVSALVDGAKVDASNVTSYVANVNTLSPGNTLTISHLDHTSNFNASDVGGNLIVSGSALTEITGGAGNDQLSSTSGGTVVIDGGAGADTMTGGSGTTVYAYSSRPVPFRATSASDLITGMDTITNWGSGAGNMIRFGDRSLSVVPHSAAAVAEIASVSVQGIASFASADNTLLLKLQAVVNAVGGDPVGTAVAFNDGSDAYLYLVGDATAGVQVNDGLIKLTGVTASTIVIADGNIVALSPFTDTAPPVVSINWVNFNDASGELTFFGTGFSSILGITEGASKDVKASFDWSKLSWDINGDNGATADIAFALADIDSVSARDSALSVTLTASKLAAIKAAPGYGALTSARDVLDISAGWIGDTAGNKATTDAAANLTMSIGHRVTVRSDAMLAPVKDVDYLSLDVSDVAQPTTLDCAQIYADMLQISGSSRNTNTITLTNLDHVNSLAVNTEYYPAGIMGNNLVMTSAATTWFKTGKGNDHITSTASGHVWFNAGGGADVLTGGSSWNTYEFSQADYLATSVNDLLTAADTITNWKAAALNVIDFDTALTVVAHNHAAVPGKASVSSAGLATFDNAETTLALKLAAVVAAAGADAAGTSIVFNDGSDAYVYVVANAASGVQAGDALIKLTGVSATQVHIYDGNITGF
jgi:hypothetical protein